MWAIQFHHDNEWKTCVRDIWTSTLQVFMFEDEAKKEFESYKNHALPHRVVKVHIIVFASENSA